MYRRISCLKIEGKPIAKCSRNKLVEVIQHGKENKKNDRQEEQTRTVISDKQY
jgi:hypothetical protein